jgi:hexosaminidase
MNSIRRSRIISAATVALAVWTASSCATVPLSRKSRVVSGAGVIPKPLRVEPRPGEFEFSASTMMIVPRGRREASPAVDELKRILMGFMGREIRTEETAAQAGETARPSGSIVLDLSDSDSALGEEGYRLDVAPDGILIRSAAPAGLFYGVQSLRQLLPFRSAGQAEGRPSIPCLSIEDRPRFSWRGGLLDSSRHFFPKEFIKRWIDILAMHKLNAFQWHLTDDQGWRVEIRKYPRLTEVGAWRVDREDSPWNVRASIKPGEKATYGGFYSQEDIRELVAYARDRFVTIIPEIEMPGHAVGALTAYPEFSCTGGPFTVLPGGYWPDTDVFCPGNEATFTFIDDVLAEVIDLFPGTYIHIGGDEVDKTEWKRCPKCQARMKAEGLKDENELQSYFIRRVEALLNARGRKLIGWDEILEGGLAPRATVMSWRGTEGGVAAARAGHDVVMTPLSHCYFDYYQGNPAYEPRAIGGFIPLEKAYSFEPVPEVLTGAEAAHILGGQANLWTEYIAAPGHAEYMALPRLAALAEAVWSPKEARDWPDFAARIPRLLARYDEDGLNSARSAYMVSIEPRTDPGRKRFTISLRTELPGLDIRFTTDGSDPGPSSKHYVKPVILKRTSELRTAAFREGRRASPAITSERFIGHAASGRVPSLALAFSPERSAGGAAGLVDGLLGSRNCDDPRWQGYEGIDFGADIDLGSSRSLKKVTIRCLQDINSDIFLPSSVEISISADGKTFEAGANVTNDVSPRSGDVLIKEFAGGLSGRKARFVRVRARNIGLVPEWHPAAGGKAWLFVDEIVVE